MKKQLTGLDLAATASRHGAKINDFGDQNIEIHARDGRISVICPKGEMRPSLLGFVCRVLRALALLALPFISLFFLLLSLGRL